MAISLKSLARNVEAENNGEWLDAPSHPGVRLKVRSLNNPDFRRAKAGYDRRMLRKFGQDVPDPQWQDREFGKLVAEHILLDWDGIDPAYDKALGAEVMADPAYRDLADDVVACARRVGDRELAESEDDAKNSATASSGTSSGDRT